MEIIREKKKYCFSSKVEDISSNYIILGMPMKSGRTFHTYIKERIYIYFSRKDSFYCIDGLVDKKRYTPIPVIFVTPITSPYKNQKRKYFRLKFSLPIHLKTDEGEEWQDAYSQDISAGGAMIYFDKKIKPGCQLEVKIPSILGDVVFKAKILRCEKEPIREINPYNIALQFLDLEANHRDEIVKFLLDEQRKLRKKGLI